MKTIEEKLERLNEGVFCNFRIGYWGARVKFDKNKLGKNVPKEIVRAAQDLLDDKVLIEDIKNIQWQAKYVLKNNSMPCPIDGIFFIPKKKIVYINEQLNSMTEEFDQRVDKFVRNYKKLVKNFSEKFPEHYDPKKYPSSGQIKNKFYMDWKFFNLGAPDSAATILDPNEYKKEVNKFKGMISEMEEMALNVIGNDLFAKIDKLQKQCESGEGLHGKTVGSINRFLDKWSDLWVGNIDDRKMKMIVSRLKKEMNKVTINRLKGNDEFRTEVSKKLNGILSKIESIPSIELKRKLDI